MEKRAREFLDLTSEYYSENQVKWSALLKSIGLTFDQDIYNDTIISIYERIERSEDFDGCLDDEILAYWYKSYVNNVRRERRYARNRMRTDTDPIEILMDREYEVGSSCLYFATIRVILNKVQENFDTQSYHLFRIYYLVPHITYDELSEIVGFDVKPRISRIRRWLIDVV